MLAGMLSADGVAAAGIGLLLAVAALGSVTASLAMGVFADRFGRRLSLLVTAGLMGVAGVLFACSESYPVLLVAAFIGTISPSTNDNSPFSAVEQAILAQACPARHHTAVFARYSMAALLAGAVGALGAAALGLLSLGEPGDAAFAMYAVYAVLSVVIMVLFWRLTPAAERDGDPTVLPEPSRPAGEARRPSPLVCTLAGLFTIDAFAGGLAVQAVLALWFQQRFGVADTQLGVLPGAGWLAGFAANRSRVRSGPSPTMPNQASRGDPVRRTPSEPWSRPRAVAIAIPCA
jgi:MFS family permease